VIRMLHRRLIYSENAKDIKENLNKIKLKLQNFFNFSLEEAFEKFIRREERLTHTNLQESSEG